MRLVSGLEMSLTSAYCALLMARTELPLKPSAGQALALRLQQASRVVVSWSTRELLWAPAPVIGIDNGATSC